jgi:DNA repair protein RecO (recombination protein O)
VLHRRDYGNTSLLLELFAHGRGRFPAIAKGARRVHRSASALLQPFQPLWLAAMGRGEVLTLTHVEAAGQPFDLTGRSLICGFYLNELMVRLLGRDDPHDALFAFYSSALDGLSSGAGTDDLLRQFELRLLDELGYGIDLSAECDGAPVTAERRYRVDAVDGIRCAPEPLGAGTLSGETLRALARGEPLREDQRREARDLLRGLLRPHLGPRPLKSRDLLQRWSTLMPTSAMANGRTTPSVTTESPPTASASSARGPYSEPSP